MLGLKILPTILAVVFILDIPHRYTRNQRNKDQKTVTKSLLTPDTKSNI